MEPPKVFASYSHDSDEHKGWVRKLCTKLREKSVDVILDQWDLGPGDDRILFMEKGVKDSNRVLVVCTAAYVKKANARERGAGYEGYIITAELVDDLGTDKFIPIIRQSSDDEKTPTFLTPKVYIDFTNDDQFDASFDQLLREIHGAPLYPKPPLGKNPFVEQSSAPEISNSHDPNVPEKIESASSTYKRAETLIAGENAFRWRQFVKQIRQDVSSSLEEWRLQFEQEKLDGTEKILEVVDKTTHIVSPLISIALAGVESGEKDFSDQKSILHDLFTIVRWKNSTYTAWIDMPNVLRYVYHALHGGLSLKTYQLNLALNLARESVRVNYPSNSRGRVWEMRNLNGAYYFNVESADLWKYVNSAYQKWKWLDLIFRDDTEYRASLVAYYMALNMHELAKEVASGNQEKLDDYYRFKVPIDFLFEKYEIKGYAIDMLLSNSTLPELWTCLDVTQEQMKNSWKTWIYQCKHQFLSNYPSIYFENSGIHPDHENFFDNL